MKKPFYLALTIVLVLLYAAVLVAENKPNDPFGKVDKAEVTVRQVKPNHFSLELAWDNDQELAALTYPLIVRGKDFKMHYDSVSWKGRAEYFAVKSVYPIDSIQQVLVGYLADITGKNPPLKSDKGTVGTLFFTAEGGAKKVVDICDVVVDTTFMKPSSVLFGVTKDGQGSVHPVYSVVKLNAAGQSAACK